MDSPQKKKDNQPVEIYLKIFLLLQKEQSGPEVILELSLVWIIPCMKQHGVWSQIH